MLRIKSHQLAATTPGFIIRHLHLLPPLGVTLLSFAEIFGIRKLEFLGYCLACLRDPTFRHFSRTPTCDRRMESRTVRHDNSSYLH